MYGNTSQGNVVHEMLHRRMAYMKNIEEDTKLESVVVQENVANEICRRRIAHEIVVQEILYKTRCDRKCCTRKVLHKELLYGKG